MFKVVEGKTFFTPLLEFKQPQGACFEKQPGCASINTFPYERKFPSTWPPPPRWLIKLVPWKTPESPTVFTLALYLRCSPGNLCGLTGSGWTLLENKRIKQMCLDLSSADWIFAVRKHATAGKHFCGDKTLVPFKSDVALRNVDLVYFNPTSELLLLFPIRIMCTA